MSLLSKTVSFFIKVYQMAVSPLFGPRCRFYPSCSEYALIVYKKFNFFRATSLTFKRLIKCGPWHPGGVDDIGSYI